MFTCVVPRCTASTILVVESFANFTEGADTVNLTGAISVDIIMHGDLQCATFCEPVWPSGKQKDLGPNLLRFSFIFKGCGLWTLSCDFVPPQLMKH